MLFKSILGLATLAGIAAAETIKVWVGQGGMTISPDEIRANVGDKVAFHFASSGHDVAQGPFGSPCTPSPSGFYSGSVPSDGVFTVDVTDTTPKWVYCSVGQHCASGMVAVINPP
jgi:plastocyanin